MADEAAAAPNQDEKQTQVKNWQKTAGLSLNKRRGPPCEYKYWDDKKCPRNGLYEVEGKRYCLNHARQYQRRQAKLKEGPKKKHNPPEPEKKIDQQEKIEKVEPKREEEVEFEKEDIVESDDDLSPVKGKMPVEELCIDTPVTKKTDEEKKRSPAVEKPHMESKRPTKMRRVAFEEDSDSSSEEEEEEELPKKKKKLKFKSSFNFPTGEKKLKGLFKGATQLNTNGQMRKPNGSVFGLFK